MVVERSKERTFRFPLKVLNLLCTWHELSIDIELSTSPSD